MPTAKTARGGGENGKRVEWARVPASERGCCETNRLTGGGDSKDAENVCVSCCCCLLFLFDCVELLSRVALRIHNTAPVEPQQAKRDSGNDPARPAKTSLVCRAWRKGWPGHISQSSAATRPPSTLHHTQHHPSLPPPSWRSPNPPRSSSSWSSIRSSSSSNSLSDMPSTRSPSSPMLSTCSTMSSRSVSVCGPSRSPTQRQARKCTPMDGKEPRRLVRSSMVSSWSRCVSAFSSKPSNDLSSRRRSRTLN